MKTNPESEIYAERDERIRLAILKVIDNSESLSLDNETDRNLLKLQILDAIAKEKTNEPTNH